MLAARVAQQKKQNPSITLPEKMHARVISDGTQRPPSAPPRNRSSRCSRSTGSRTSSRRSRPLRRSRTTSRSTRTRSRCRPQTGECAAGQRPRHVVLPAPLFSPVAEVALPPAFFFAVFFTFDAGVLVVSCGGAFQAELRQEGHEPGKEPLRSCPIWTIIPSSPLGPPDFAPPQKNAFASPTAPSRPPSTLKASIIPFRWSCDSTDVDSIRRNQLARRRATPPRQQ